MKICILIIYSFSEQYALMKIILQNYYTRYNKEIYFYFLESNEKIENDIEFHGNTINIKLPETCLNIMHKTVMSMEAVCNKHKDFDFLVRTNISTIIDIENLMKFLHSIPKNNIFCGGSIMNLKLLDHNCGINDKSLFGTVYIQGTGIIMSKDIVTSVCNNKTKFNYSVVDDVSFGVFINQYHYTILPSTLWLEKYNAKMICLSDLSNVNEIYKIPNVVFYRNKSINRINDIVHIKELSDFLLQKNKKIKNKN